MHSPPYRHKVHALAALGCGAFLCLLSVYPGRAQDAPGSKPALTCTEMEHFLETAKIVSQRDLPVGVTIPRRATLDDGKMRHDASLQFVDESKPVFQGTRSTELNFRDSWKFNVAAYEIAKMLQLNMVPPYVERTIDRQPASVSWWVNDAMMGRERYQKKIPPPDPARWNQETYAARIFHQLIHDSDPNLTNLLITQDWRIWMIDFTRAFRWTKALQKPGELVKADRRLLARLRELTTETLQRQAGRWLTGLEIEGVLARRDLILQHFEDAVRTRGEALVLYDLPRTAESCGTGLQ